jgi:hypothetical protein
MLSIHPTYGCGVVLVFIGVLVVVVFVVVLHWLFACFVLDTIFVTSRSLSLMILDMLQKTIRYS